MVQHHPQTSNNLNAWDGVVFVYFGRSKFSSALTIKEIGEICLELQALWKAAVADALCCHPAFLTRNTIRPSSGEHSTWYLSMVAYEAHASRKHRLTD